MNWQSQLTSLTYADPEGRFSLRQELRPPANENEIDEAENRLQLRFPHSLRSLLFETNGVMRMMTVDGENWFEELWTVWPVETIVEENLRYREQFAGRDGSQWLFFAGAGADGILFGFPHHREAVEDGPVFARYLDETEDKQMAEHLDRFLTEWCRGRLAV